MAVNDPNPTHKTSVSQVIIHILAWVTRIFLIGCILGLVISLAISDPTLMIQVCVTNVALVFILIFLPDKWWTQIISWIKTDWKSKENGLGKLLYNISIIFYWLGAIGVGLTIILVVFPIMFSLISQNLLIFIPAIGSAIILVFALEWVMKLISK